jgi:biopolymer transport protein ExbD
MKLDPPWDHRRRPSSDDQALPLINIAFLLLVFFLMAGTLVLPEPFSLQHLQVTEGETSKPVPQILSVAHDGRLAYRGEIVDQSELVSALFADLQEPLPVKVDAQADAQRVIDLLRHLGRVGVAKVRLIGVVDVAR